ncbi:MAG: hypothetical protein R2839_00755 [Thermomicrobiales bacterium]
MNALTATSDGLTLSALFSDGKLARKGLDELRIIGATTYIVGNPWKNLAPVNWDTDQPGLYGIVVAQRLRQNCRDSSSRTGALL